MCNLYNYLDCGVKHQFYEDLEKLILKFENEINLSNNYQLLSIIEYSKNICVRFELIDKVKDCEMCKIIVHKFSEIANKANKKLNPFSPPFCNQIKSHDIEETFKSLLNDED